MENTLTVTRLNALQQEWQTNPPIALMIAAYLGIKPREEGNVEDLISKIADMEKR